MAGDPRPLERALADPGFLSAFAQRYAGDDEPLDALRWLDDPEAPGLDGSPGPGAAVRAAARDLYRPGAGEPQRLAHRHLAHRLAESRRRTLAALEEVDRQERVERAAAGDPPADADADAGAAAISAAGDRVRSRRPHRAAALVGAGVLVAVLGTSTWIGGRSMVAPTPRPSPLDFTTPIAALIEAEPQRLPAGWRDGTVVSSSDALDGAVALLAPAGQRGRLLLVVRCRSSGRSFQAVISGGETRVERYGACGRLQSVPLPVRPDALVRVVVTTRGIEPFSGALVRR